MEPSESIKNRMKVENERKLGNSADYYLCLLVLFEGQTEVKHGAWGGGDEMDDQHRRSSLFHSCKLRMKGGRSDIRTCFFFNVGQSRKVDSQIRRLT